MRTTRLFPGRRSSYAARGPIARIAIAVVSAVAFVVAAILGAFVFLALAGVAVVAFTAVWLRLVWLRRRLRGAGQARSARTGNPQSGGGVIEGEYSVVDDRQPRRETHSQG